VYEYNMPMNDEMRRTWIYTKPVYVLSQHVAGATEEKPHNTSFK